MSATDNVLMNRNQSTSASETETSPGVDRFGLGRNSGVEVLADGHPTTTYRWMGIAVL